MMACGHEPGPASSKPTDLTENGTTPSGKHRQP